MAAMIKGITVTLYNKTQTGVDDFNRPTYKDIPEAVDNILVSPVSSTEVIDTLNLTGKKTVYEIAIPKGDLHTWTDRKISFFGEDWKAVGEPIEGIDDNIPLAWNKKVKVEKYG